MTIACTARWSVALESVFSCSPSLVCLTGLTVNNTFNLGLNIIAQAGVNFSGIHFDRAGATPIWPDVDKYEKYYGPAGMSPIDRATDGINFGRKDRNQGITLGNRLLTLYDTSILGNGEDTPKEEKGKVGQFFENTGNKI